MTFKIYAQIGNPQLVKEKIHNTYLLFFHTKKKTHAWFSVWGVSQRGASSHWKEVEFESWEQVHELTRFHPEVKHRMFSFIGYKEKLHIGSTNKWTSV